MRVARTVILNPQSAVPRCTAVVDLLSRVLRPYLFQVTVNGEPPHKYRRVYTIRAPSDDSAAMKGMELFVKEFTSAAPVRQMETLAPKAVRQ